MTILVSAAVSLTLTTMMCALLLKRNSTAQQGRLYRASERVFGSVIAKYGSTLRWILKHQPLTLMVTLATLAATLRLYVIAPKSFFPIQDTGVILGISEAPQTISFAAMAGVGQIDFDGPGRPKPVLFHRGRRDQSDSQ